MLLQNSLNSINSCKVLVKLGFGATPQAHCTRQPRALSLSHMGTVTLDDRAGEGRSTQKIKSLQIWKNTVSNLCYSPIYVAHANARMHGKFVLRGSLFVLYEG